MVDYCPCDGEIIALEVYHSEKCNGAMGAVEEELQIEGEAE
jgi:hypothetical protein